MKDQEKAREKLIKEVTQLRRRMAELETVNAARMQVEDELRRERDLAQKYLDIAGVFLLIVDLEERVALINRKGCEILGYEEEEILGKNYFDHFLSEKLREKARDDFKKIVAGERKAPDYIESRVQRRDGTERVIAWHYTILTDDDRRIEGVLSSGEDLSRREQAEAALRESEAKLQSIFRAAPTGIGVVSPDRTIMQVNERICEMLGYSREELEGKNARVVYASDEDYEYVGTEKYRQIDERGTGTVETRWRRKDGRVIDILLSSSPIDPSNRAAGVTFTALDITEPRRIALRIGKLNRLFLSLGADLIDNMEKIVKASQDILDCPYTAFCLFSHGRLSILSSAPGEEGFAVSASPEEHICYSLIAGDSREPLVVPDLGKTGFSSADPLIAKRGFRSYLGYPVLVEGRKVGCLSLFDHREREFSGEDIEIAGMLAQALSVEQERLDREEDLKDFIDVASHELRHPVTIIKGYAATLRELWHDLSRQERMELLDAIEYGTDRLNRLAMELLDVSRIERGQFPLNKKDLAVAPLLESAISGIRQEGLSNPFNLSISDRIGTVKADPDKIIALFYILLDNAVTYSPPGTEVDIKVEQSEDMVVVQVMDRGKGVPDNDRERVFDRFYQVEDALHHSIPGMGIGLYIAREIVEAHGGRIWNEAREGGGSVFCFSLPMGE